MKVYGLTGGVGMGKSASEQLLRQRGVAVVDTDQIARELVEPGQPALAEIHQYFGSEVIGTDGRLRREVLARQVFTDPSSRQVLEGLLHPRIRYRWRALVGQWREEGLPLAVVVIPLLFETQAETELDATVCVACSAESQRQRLLGRGWSRDHLEQRIRSQWPIEAKIAKADFVIWTEGGMEVHAAQWERLLARAGFAGHESGVDKGD